jgi:M6 family metalloprotease-like protein
MVPVQGTMGRVRKPFALSVFLFLWLISCAVPAWAVPASPLSFQELQPDGTPIRLRVRGDEHFNWTEDLKGYTVVHDGGWFEYARLNPQGRLVPSGLRVGHSDPYAHKLKRRILPSTAQRAASRKSSTGGSSASVQTVLASGAIRNLVVLIQFADHVGRPLPSTAEIDALFNAVGGDPVAAPTGSVRDVYLQNSYGQVELNSDVMPWVTVSGTEAYYANGVSGDRTLWEALREALTVLDGSVDFGRYDQDNDGQIDSIAFLHSGYGAEWGVTSSDGALKADRIWSHRWSLQDGPWVSGEGVSVTDYHISTALWGTTDYAIGRIGVIAHETGHFFGLPDLYDTDGGGTGIGSFGLMANAWDFAGSQLCPPHFSPWSKLQLGWIEPVDISQAGEYRLGQSETHNEYFVITQGFPANEYLMIENRQNAGFDCSLPQGGLAVWHIDDEAGFNTEGFPSRRWPQNGLHYRVALAQADGDFDLEQGLNRGDAGDLHHAGGVDAMSPGPDGHPNTDAYQDGRIVVTGHTLSNISAAGPEMTFCLNGCGGSPGPGDGYAAPSDLAASLGNSGNGKTVNKRVTLTWSDNSNGGGNEDVFVIERCLENAKGRTVTCDFLPHATVGQDVMSFSETAGGETYRYRVKARRGGSDDTGYSNEVTI